MLPHKKTGLYYYRPSNFHLFRLPRSEIQVLAGQAGRVGSIYVAYPVEHVFLRAKKMRMAGYKSQIRTLYARRL